MAYEQLMNNRPLKMFEKEYIKVGVYLNNSSVPKLYIHTVKSTLTLILKLALIHYFLVIHTC